MTSHTNKQNSFCHFSLVMINLVVAIIVSDIDELKREGVIQDTINKAYHIISHGNIVAVTHSIKSKKVDDRKSGQLLKDKTEICMHSICFNCNGIKVSSNVQNNLSKLVKKRSTAT